MNPFITAKNLQLSFDTLAKLHLPNTSEKTAKNSKKENRKR